MRSQRGPPLRSPRHSPTSGSNNDEPSSTVLDPALADPIRRQVQSCRKADFHEVLGGTSHTPSVLRRIPLSPRCDVDTAQAFRDAVREDIVLNGVQFVGDHRTEAFVAAVKRIVEKYISTPKKSLHVSDRVMRSCSRTHSGADSYFALQELFGHPDLLIKPRQDPPPPPLDVTLGVDRKGTLKCRICAANLYGLYRHDDIEQEVVYGRTAVVPPFVLVDTVIVEEINFTTDVATRYLSVRSPVPDVDVHSELRELF
ncbi:hypothetical protein H257_03800 [Aphanomyces astaci]|uniref:Uncharacterized protein n=1 Tax=Aphanomyces astaci TaxID=112090 RepID=W4H072_APHAT|nr:hypothetical protein H257_03800 [Aphanomyces astaci]ETV84659.1 hypothetical protein H257_03800 [Aphanomyces astaci]|eukprot:XP_009826351.1 hypothetical protein H257_03800 [Aphanomyces astaci]